MIVRQILITASVALGVAYKAYKLYELHKRVRYYESLHSKESYFNQLQNRD